MIGCKKINTGLWYGMSKEADIGTFKTYVFFLSKINVRNIFFVI